MGKQVALLYGGTSSERRVSLDSAAAVKASLEKRYEVCSFDTASDNWALELLNSAVDGVFICLHGGAGKMVVYKDFVRAYIFHIRAQVSLQALRQ